MTDDDYGYDVDAMNNSEGGGTMMPPGEYIFTVVHAENRTAKTGTEYTNLTLACYGDREFKVYDRFFYTTNSLWRIKQFIDCVGCKPPKKSDPSTWMGFKGNVTLRQGDRYLEVERYNAQHGNITDKAEEIFQAPQSEKDIPF